MSRGRRKRRGSGLSGVLLVDKPVGPTSHDLVQWVRWALRERAVGHCGTLDPAACGLLVVCVGPGTRLVRYLTSSYKQYRATFVLGTRTDTADRDGAVVERAAVEADHYERAPEALAGMVGSLQLPPPAYSAIRVGGQRAHELARSGAAVELDPRPMIVESVTDVRTEPASGAVVATLRVSKGTYIRSLAEELGRRLGVPAHLGGLIRVRSGSFVLDDPRVITDVRVDLSGERPTIGLELEGEPLERDEVSAVMRGRLIAVADALPFAIIELGVGPDGVDAARRLGHGQALALDHPALAGRAFGPQGGGHLGICGADGGLVIARVTDSELQPERVVLPLSGQQDP